MNTGPFVKSVIAPGYSGLLPQHHNAPAVTSITPPAVPPTPRGGTPPPAPNVAAQPVRTPEQPHPLADGVQRVRLVDAVGPGGEVVYKAAWIKCPGCGYLHSLPYQRNPGSQGPTWTFNGDLVAPTFSPSLRCFHTRPARDGRPAENVTGCHTFIRGGWINFLDDSHAHQLRGWHKLPAYGDDQ
jgi:hypothetical protein